MNTQMKIGLAALVALLATIDQAFAGIFPLLPPSSPPVESVPEIDAASGIAAMALLVSVGAMFFSRRKHS